MKKKIEVFKRDILYQYYSIRVNQSGMGSQVIVVDLINYQNTDLLACL